MNKFRRFLVLPFVFLLFANFSPCEGIIHNLPKHCQEVRDCAAKGSHMCYCEYVTSVPYYDCVDKQTCANPLGGQCVPESRVCK